MKTSIRLFLVCFLALAAHEFLFAQMGAGMRPPDIPGVFKPVVGSGAAYETVTKNGTKMSLEIAIIDKESDGYWMEIAAEMPRMPGTNYVKELLVRQGDDLVIEKMIVQMPGHPPIDLSSMPRSIQSQKSQADFRANAQNLGTDSITTPAGTFSCQHWRDAKSGDDYWISDKVVPWQLVKMTGADGHTITLVRVITDAKTHITGTPVSMQEMMQQQMGKPNR